MTPESCVLKAVTDLLTVQGVLWFRINTGATIIPANGSHARRFIRYGTKGMADILAAPIDNKLTFPRPIFFWIEVKAPGGRQSEDQKTFELMVKSRGHEYVVVDDATALLDYMRIRRLSA